MTKDELLELAEKYETAGKIHKFDDVANKLSQRPDLHAMILLDRLVPGNMCMIAAADHDQVYLETDLDELAKVITEEQLIELFRCGVWFDDNGLNLFV